MSKTSDTSQSGYRSLFWPFILIGVGVIWLLGNLNIISGANLAVLFRMWPLILIIIGLDLLFGRRAPQLGALIGIGGITLIIGLMIVGPSVGLVESAEIQTNRFEEALDGVESAHVSLDLSAGSTRVEPLEDSNQLFVADVSYIGAIDFQVEGASERYISIGQSGNQGFVSGNPFDLLWNTSNSLDGQSLTWNIRLAREVPIDLDINGSVGDTWLELTDVNLTGLSINGGVGSTTLMLPTVEGDYDVDINGGVGDTRVSIADGAALRIDINGGVGGMTIDVPENTAVRVEFNGGMGGINVPSTYERTNGNDDTFNDQGTWETPGFEEAERQIEIIFDGGVGGLNIR